MFWHQFGCFPVIQSTARLPVQLLLKNLSRIPIQLYFRFNESAWFDPTIAWRYPGYFEFPKLLQQSGTCRNTLWRKTGINYSNILAVL